MTGSPVVSVIIVTYNSASVIRDCLDPLVVATFGPAIEIIVVDNNSTDETMRIVEEISPCIRIIRNKENQGFARAVNSGAEMANGTQLLLLNPDATISSDSLQQLLRISDRSRPAVIAPLIVHPGGRLRIVSAGRFPSVWRMFCHYSGLSRFGRVSAAFEGHYLLPSQLQSEMQTGWVTGACVLIPRIIWTQLGGLSQRWFMYAEDIDFCWRANQAGYNVLLATEVVVTHSVGESTDEPKSLNADWVTNLFDFYRTEMNGSELAGHVWKAVVVFGLYSRSVAFKYRAIRLAPNQQQAAWAQESRRFSEFARQLKRVGI